MAEFTNAISQSVPQNGNVLFAEEPIMGNNCIKHREGSGLIALYGAKNQCRSRYKVEFAGNISIPTTGDAGSISLSIAIDGEAISSSSMIQTLSATNEYSNVSSALYVDVPNGCCVNVSIKNTSTQTINVQNANLIIERKA